MASIICHRWRGENLNLHILGIFNGYTRPHQNGTAYCTKVQVVARVLRIIPTILL
jgi:hypothetical protein